MKKNLYLITPDFDGDISSYLASLKKSIEHFSPKRVQFRSKNLDRKQYIEMAKCVSKLCKESGADIIVNADVDVFNELQSEVDGLHLTSVEMTNTKERPIPSEKLLSGACHNIEQVKIASRIGCDFAVLCPIFKTPSSPKGIPVGWPSFSKMVSTTTMPIYALGGIGLDDYDTAIANGAFGIAAKRGLWFTENILKDEG
ncbi:thiamine phosphate synthase [Shewanella sp. 202IG2-18]|uniref:thiamine phosphate synthase n=1 Tax=Parashewanella hymeniacidonis TaxID=2807618 RepID=UPI00195F9739|nr:thiamine phosphate synthase [Parashewanella hymeniacidonis]MBM7073262.1 thiamine phosphate synthase [Parashewanella hymeniacidonis]